MKYRFYSCFLLSPLMLTSCSTFQSKDVGKENLENLRLGMSVEQVLATVKETPQTVLNYPRYSVFEYPLRLKYNNDIETSEFFNLFKKGFDQRQNYEYMVNFFGITPENDQRFIFLIKDNPSLNKIRYRIIQYHLYDSAKPIYRLFGTESPDFNLYVGQLKVSHPYSLSLVGNETVNACLIFEKNRLRGVFAAYVPTQERTQPCAVSLNLRNEYIK